MRVVVHPADDGGCGHYRLIFPAAVLNAAGDDVHIRLDDYRAVWTSHPLIGERVIDLAQDVDADVVVLQRPLHRNRYELLLALQRRGVAVVVEIDDDFHAIDRRNPAWRITNPLFDRDRNRDWLMRACDAADLVTCSTQAIADRYAPHGRVVVLPNLVPEWYLTVERERVDDRVVIGWTGSTRTHPGDLEVTGGQVGEAVRTAGAAFGVVGTGEGVQKALHLDEPPLAAGWLPITQYPRAMASFDVGIVPLALSPFNEAKSWLKMLEFASLGVPAVVSPTTENTALFARGVGVTAAPFEWRMFVHELATNAEWRSDLAAQGRAVASDLTYEKQSWRWLEAWSQAMVHQRARKVPA